MHVVADRPTSIAPGLAEAVPAFSPTFAHLVAAPVPAPADGQLQLRYLFLFPLTPAVHELHPPKSDQNEKATSKSKFFKLCFLNY